MTQTMEVRFTTRRISVTVRLAAFLWIMYLYILKLVPVLRYDPDQFIMSLFQLFCVFFIAICLSVLAVQNK